MNDTLQLQQEAYHVLAEVLIVIGVGFGIWGISNLLEGYDKNIPSAKELGERQIKAGGNLVVLATYIEKGALPLSEMIDYLASR